MAASLISGRLHHESHEGLEVIVGLNKIIGQSAQKSLIGGGVRDTHVIDRFYQSDTKVIRPDSVGDGSRKIGVVAGGQPVSKVLATVCGIIEGKRFAIEWSGFLRLAGERLNQITFGVHEDGSFSTAITRVTSPAFRSHAREEIRHSVVLVVGPFLEGVIVAFRATNGESHEGLADIFGHRFRVLVQRIKIGCSIYE